MFALLAAAWAWSKSNPKIILWIVIAALAAGLAWKLYNNGWRACKAEQQAARVAQLEDALQLEREYSRRLLESQNSNKEFVQRQKKALRNDQTADAPMPALFINTMRRLRDDRR